MVIGIYGKLCETETGQNNIIVDIEESRGNGELKTVTSLKEDVKLKLFFDWILEF